MMPGRAALSFRLAFTLTEMLVALAVTVLALGVVTSVFSVTTRTAAVAAAIAEVETFARNFADQLRQDLEYCDPAESILVIHGRTQPAALTEDFRQAGQYYRVLTGDPGALDGLDPRFSPTLPAQYSDPRADILMFFTNRPSVSKAPATGTPSDAFQQKLQAGVRVSPIQVVYGHAALDSAVQSGATWVFANNLDHIEAVDASGISLLPANRWPLSRRATLLEEPASGGPSVPVPQFMNDDFDRIVRCYSTDPTLAADAVQFSLQDYLALYAPSVGASGTLQGRALLSPYLFPTIAGYPSLGPGHVPWSPLDAPLVNWVLYYYGIEANHHVATVIEQPPAALQDNLGLHLLPGCVWFQVEFLLPEDPRNGLDHPLPYQRRDTPRWVEVEPGQTYVFVPDTYENRQLVESQVSTSGMSPGMPLPDPNRLRRFAQVIPPGMASLAGLPYNGNTAENRRVRMWPYAIRVTVRVLDQRGRIEEPIVRSVVHRFD